MPSAPLKYFFRLTFALSWGLGGLYLLARWARPDLSALDASNPVFLLINCAPSLAAVILSARARGLEGVRDLAAQVFRGFRPGLFVMAFAALPLLVCLLSMAAQVLHQPWPVSLHVALVEMPMVLLTTPLLFANIAPLGEEFGWRGYALPLLLKRWPPVFASLFLGVIWIVWHIPAFLLGGVMAVTLASFFWWSLATLALSVFMTTFHVRSGGNLLIAGIVPHAMIDALGARGLWTDRPAEAIALALCAAAATMVSPRSPRS